MISFGDAAAKVLGGLTVETDDVSELKAAARYMLNSLETERSDLAWRKLTPAQKADRYDRAVERLSAALKKVEAQ